MLSWTSSRKYVFSRDRQRGLIFLAYIRGQGNDISHLTSGVAHIQNGGTIMSLKHKVQISIANDTKKKPVLKSGVKHIPYRILTALFGEFMEVLVLIPGQSVETVEIREIRGGNYNAH